MIELKILADILMTVGTLIGIYSKGYALVDSKTVWSRKSSLPNILTYPITALLPALILELYLTLGVMTISFFIWVGIYFFRAPSNEDWLGR